MISPNDIQDFLNETIAVLYLDSGKEIFAKGTLVSYSESSLRLETHTNTLIIPFTSVLKVKIPR